MLTLTVTLTKLGRAIQNKRRGMLSHGIMLLHDNARPLAGCVTQSLINDFGWERIDHLPYSLDLAPSNYHLLLYLECSLASQLYDNDDVKNVVK